MTRSWLVGYTTLVLLPFVCAWAGEESKKTDLDCPGGIVHQDETGTHVFFSKLKPFEFALAGLDRTTQSVRLKSAQLPDANCEAQVRDGKAGFCLDYTGRKPLPEADVIELQWGNSSATYRLYPILVTLNVEGDRPWVFLHHRQDKPMKPVRLGFSVTPWHPRLAQHILFVGMPSCFSNLEYTFSRRRPNGRKGVTELIVVARGPAAGGITAMLGDALWSECCERTPVAVYSKKIAVEKEPLCEEDAKGMIDAIDALFPNPKSENDAQGVRKLKAFAVRYRIPFLKRVFREVFTKEKYAKHLRLVARHSNPQTPKQAVTGPTVGISLAHDERASR